MAFSQICLAVYALGLVCLISRCFAHDDAGSQGALPMLLLLLVNDTAIAELMLCL